MSPAGSHKLRVGTSYQGAGIFRAVIIIMAYILQSRTLYHDSIVIIHAFAYTRFIIWLFTIRQSFPNEELSELDSLNTEKDKVLIKDLYKISGSNKSLMNIPQTYTAGVYGSALVAIGHQEDELMRKFGMAAFLITMALLMRLEQWSADNLMGYLQGKDITTLKQKLAWKLYEVGICRIQVLSQLDKAVTPDVSAKSTKT
ncbi:hypothetical protein ABW20_dc0104099 [Dactylellina cionopaga]|nr:hypothetical protein ABW20_dc0104099 [Dactylellina cionopaga]